MSLLLHRSGLEAGQRPGLHKEIFDDFRHQASLFGLGRFAHNGRQIEFPFGQPLQGRVGDLAKALGLHLLHDAVLDDRLGQVVGVHVAHHLFQLVGRKDIAQHVEDLAGLRGVQVFFNLGDPFKQLLHHPSLAGLGRDKIEDETILFLAIPVDAAHTLLQAHRIPGDVEVNHQPTELQVNALAGRFGGYHHLAILPKLPLGIDAAARCVAVADLHPAVDLGHLQAPLAQLAQRTAPFAVAGQIIEGIFMLRENQEFQLLVVKQTLLGDDFSQLDQLGLDLFRLQVPRLIDELAQLDDFGS